MNSLRRDWNEFWFSPISSVPLGVFRMVYGALALAYTLLLFPERFVWFGSRGVLPLAESDIYNGTGAGALHLNLLAFPGADHWLTLFFVVLILACISLIIGFWSRASAVIIYLCINTLHSRNAVIHHSGDTVMLVMAAYLALSPAGAACSIDRLRRIFRGKESDTPPLIVPWAQRLMQLQVATVYLGAILSKAGGEKWVNGTAAYYPIHLSESARFPMLGSDTLWVINLVTWGTMAIELALATLIWVPRLRLYVLASGVMLHLGIEYSLNIPLFSFMMISTYITFLTAADFQNFLAWVKRPLQLTPLRLVYDGECDFCRSSLLAVRFLDVFRQITFIDSHDEAAREAAGVRFEDAEEAAIAVNPAGRQFAGFDAFRAIAFQLPATALLAPILYLLPIPQLGRRAYGWIKENRSRLPIAARYQGRMAEKEPERETLPLN